MDCLSPSTRGGCGIYETLQIGGTEVLINAAMYYAKHDRALWVPIPDHGKDRNVSQNSG